MLLKNLINNLPHSFEKLNIKGLALNSKYVKRGFIFFAIKGRKHNGEKYINHAIKNGAILIVCSKNVRLKNCNTKILKTNKVRSYLEEATSKFYKNKPNNIIAVTGTNGKTSVADFFYQILTLNKIPAASIGTLGIKSPKKNIKTSLTSPDIITLHKNLAELKENNIDNVIIEASSHGLDQGRLNKINFKAGIFTNFSQDHLDYHQTMKKYLRAKLILFSKLLRTKSFIISDNSIKEYSYLKKISKKKQLKFLDMNKEIGNIKNKFVPLIGSFQFKNLAMSVLAARLCNLSKFQIYKKLNLIKDVNGRLNLIKKYSNNIKVFIDYAHTPEALSTSLKSLKETYNNNISLVFGCGGERDFKKRPLMAKAAKTYCNKIYVTDDNPRMENPVKIRKQIINHLKGTNYFNIGNRSAAIKQAIINAEPNETILIAGKGHEAYQDYGNRVINISDKEIIHNLKIKKRKLNINNQNYLLNSKILNKILKNKKLLKFNDISIDSRKIKKKDLFLAIKGKINDGNKYISHAFKKGASFAVTSKFNKKKKKIIKVKDPLIFLNKFANFKRDNCNAKIIGITGSAGKTSLKDLLYKILTKFDDTYASPRSFNNHYGVPISLSNIKLNHRYGIFEVGMSKAGEIYSLSKMIRPDLAVITNIAEAHIENFKNLKGIAEAKAEIINNIKPFGTIVLNRDDKFFNYLNKKAKINKIKVVSFGKSRNSDIRLIKVINNKKNKLITISLKDQIIKFNIKETNVYNILASLAVLKILNIGTENIFKEFIKFGPSSGRGKSHKVKRYNKIFYLIDESYNANPLSVRNAINNFSVLKKKNKSKKYFLFGDMLELGKKSKIYHAGLSKLINSSDIDKVFVKGENSLFTYKNLIKSKRGNIIQCNEDVDLILKNIIDNNDYLMIKGSNATGLNVISNKMIKGL